MYNINESYVYIFLRGNYWSFYLEWWRWRECNHRLWPLQSLDPIATSCLPLNFSATNSEFVDVEWVKFLLEIYFRLWWGFSLLSKLIVQIRLLESCLDYLEECFQGISLFVPANRYCYLHMYLLYPLIKSNPVATLLVYLVSQLDVLLFFMLF